MPDAPFKIPQDPVNVPVAHSPLETAAVLALASTPGASAAQVARAVTRAGSARRVLEEGPSGDARAVAIVGTRQPTPRALARARRAAIALTDAEITVVSGLAAGIDTAAHVATLDAGRRTIAVIATGLQRVYPGDNADLQARIAKDGAVISQFPPDTQPARRNFPIRNALTAGLALAVLLIEARPDSGSLITVRHALRYGRPTYLPGSLLEHDWARSLATEPGVRVIDDPHQIAAAFPTPPTRQESRRKIDRTRHRHGTAPETAGSAA